MDIHKELKEEIHRAQEHEDQHRVQNPTYHIGEKVWLLRNNLHTSRPCAKLEHQRFGPFTILAEVNLVTFKLRLPSTMRIHPVFHVSMSEPYFLIDSEFGELMLPLYSRRTKTLRSIVYLLDYDI
ncbi:hypothetical protein KP509_27G036900 [Ceratopteris richardii]|uniref:Tf2-1-like SH3-like domain-containing protein n=1 Tax=Ceratopteris richardii TaxID=49495 RepID=A0A8T2RI06_CERRI|nr:hypothetical protein KP509_27G036900 [Ceratopteris richardii]